MLANLAKQDKRYEIGEQYLSRRVRLGRSYFKTAQDDASIVFSTPNDTRSELPFVFSFKLVEGKLAPSPSKFAIQQIDTSDITFVS